MLQFLLFSMLLAVTLAYPEPVPQAGGREQVQQQSDGLGNYNVLSVDKDGTRLSESGQIKEVNGKQVDVKQGDFAYVAPDTKQSISQSWQADEKGFKAQGNAIPTPPPIPVEISRMLAEKQLNPPYGPGSLVQ